MNTAFGQGSLGDRLESAFLRAGGGRGAKTSALGRVGNWLGDQTYQFVNRDLPDLGYFAKRDARRLKEGVTSKINSWGAGVRQTWSGARNRAKVEAGRAVDAGRRIVDTAKEEARRTADTIKSDARSVYNSAASSASSAYNSAASTVNSAYSSAASTASSVWGKVKSWW